MNPTPINCYFLSKILNAEVLINDVGFHSLHLYIYIKKHQHRYQINGNIHLMKTFQNLDDAIH